MPGARKPLTLHAQQIARVSPCLGKGVRHETSETIREAPLILGLQRVVISITNRVGKRRSRARNRGRETYGCGSVPGAAKHSAISSNESLEIAAERCHVTDIQGIVGSELILQRQVVTLNVSRLVMQVDSAESESRSIH